MDCRKNVDFESDYGIDSEESDDDKEKEKELVSDEDKSESSDKDRGTRPKKQRTEKDLPMTQMKMPSEENYHDTDAERLEPNINAIPFFQDTQ